MNPSNPAAMQGWVKSVDPQSGRVFYANHITRKTQWEAPDGWVEEVSPPLMPPEPEDDDDDELPPGWQVARDPASGKAFYVNVKTRQVSRLPVVFTQLTISKVTTVLNKSCNFLSTLYCVVGY